MRILVPLQAILITRVYREIKEVEEVQEKNREMVEQFELQKRYLSSSGKLSKELADKYNVYMVRQQDRRKKLLKLMDCLKRNRGVKR